MTRVQRDVDSLSSNPKMTVPKTGSPWLSKKLYDGVYDAEKMHGVPVGVQIVGPAWHEEKVLKMMKVLDEALEKLHGKQFGPGLAQNFVNDSEGERSSDQ